MKLDNSFALLSDLEGEHHPPPASKKLPSPAVEERLSSKAKKPPLHRPLEHNNATTKSRRIQKHKTNKNLNKVEEIKADDMAKKSIGGSKTSSRLREILASIFFLIALVFCVRLFLLRSNDFQFV